MRRMRTKESLRQRGLSVSQLIMRVHQPKVEYKLVLQGKTPWEKLDILVWSSIKTI